MNSLTLKVGRITVALGLVAVGTALLADNLLSGYNATGLILKFWPLLLVGFGVEYLIHTAIAHQRNDERRLRFDVGGAFLLAFIILLTAGITGFRTWVPRWANVHFNVGPSESRTETKSVPAGNAKELQADVTLGAIVLMQSTTPEVRVEATYTTHGFTVGEDAQRRLEEIKLNITEGESIRITSERPGEWTNLSVKYVIYAPNGLKVRAKTGAGSIEVQAYKGDLDLNSNAGRIDVEAGAGSLIARSGAGMISVRTFEGPVDAHTNVGSIQMRNIVGSLQMDSGTGSIDVEEFRGGKLVAETRTGRIDVSTRAALEGDVSLKTQAGSIRLSVPEESGMRVTAQTRAGSISAPDFVKATRQGASGNAVGTQGDGKYTVNLEASTGSIHLDTH